MKEGEKHFEKAVFFPPSLFPAHVQLLTDLTTPPGWRQRQTYRQKAGQNEEILYQTSSCDFN